MKNNTNFVARLLGVGAALLRAIKKHVWLTIMGVTFVAVLVAGIGSVIWLIQSDRMTRIGGELVRIQDATIQSERHRFHIRAAVNDLNFPWGMAFIPSSNFILITEKLTSQIIMADPVSGGKSALTRVAGVKAAVIGEHCGLLDITLHPNFLLNGWVYVAYLSENTGKGFLPVIARARYFPPTTNHKQNEASTTNAHDAPTPLSEHVPQRLGGTFSEFETVLVLDQGDDGLVERLGSCGMRLSWLPDNTLLAVIGQESSSTRYSGQIGSSLRGKIIRINDDGTIPPDNPFVDDPDIRDEIYTLGHRDPQGLAITNSIPPVIWSTEHGPYGGDELNRIVAGKNYGWPYVTYGFDYLEDRASILRLLEYLGLLNTLLPHEKVPVGFDAAHEPYGYVEPIQVWGKDGNRSIAPSGLMWYNSSLFPQWRGNLFVAVLYKRHLLRIELQNNQVVHQEKLLNNKLGRIRHVIQHPTDGSIYLITDAERGSLYHITPR